MDAGCDELPFGYIDSLEPYQKKLTEILNIAESGQFDGAHHKDWVIQQIIRIANGWDEEALQKHLKEMEWEPGIPP